ncbi:MAG: hypothetical protein KDC00_03125 [Flavobacteriales bacterium]|nr:hypothetical protein [Flavobacteriales bacterium]
MEVLLRGLFGFCDTVLMRADPNYEYIAQPSQDRCRFGNRIVYNSLSMRSEEPDTSGILILGCGDSVINGGVLTDQDSLATEHLSHDLSAALGKRVQVLNLSAGSWGPDNCAAYLRSTPVPAFEALVLFTSSHDAHDNMSFKPVVGVNKSFPSEQYSSALVELWDRYLLPRISKEPVDADGQLGIDKGGDGFNPGFMGLKDYADRRGIPFIIFLHADMNEVVSGSYDPQGQEIIRFAEAHGIHLIKDLDHGVDRDMLRDKIHPNESGQWKIASIVLSELLSSDTLLASLR